MSDLDIKALQTNFEVRRKDCAPDLKVSKSFERFSVEQILKDIDPWVEEIESGDLGGHDDGGVDAMLWNPSPRHSDAGWGCPSDLGLSPLIHSW
jgi:hypothetical protein